MMPSPIRFTMWPTGVEQRRLDGPRHLTQKRERGIVARLQRPGRKADQVGEDQRHLRVCWLSGNGLGQRLPYLQHAQTDLPRCRIPVAQQPVGGSGSSSRTSVTGSRQRITELWVAGQQPPRPPQERHDPRTVIGGTQPPCSTVHRRTSRRLQRSRSVFTSFGLMRPPAREPQLPPRKGRWFVSSQATTTAAVCVTSRNERPTRRKQQTLQLADHTSSSEARPRSPATGTLSCRGRPHPRDSRGRLLAIQEGFHGVAGGVRERADRRRARWTARCRLPRCYFGVRSPWRGRDLSRRRRATSPKATSAPEVGETAPRCEAYRSSQGQFDRAQWIFRIEDGEAGEFGIPRVEATERHWRRLSDSQCRRPHPQSLYPSMSVPTTPVRVSSRR